MEDLQTRSKPTAKMILQDKKINRMRARPYVPFFPEVPVEPASVSLVVKHPLAAAALVLEQLDRQIIRLDSIQGKRQNAVTGDPKAKSGCQSRRMNQETTQHY